MKPLLFIALLISLAVSSALAQPRPVTINRAKLDAIFDKHNNPGKPGGAVLVLQGGKVVYEKAFGLASIEQNVRNSTKTVFNLNYGESREFTALTVAMLAEEGVLSLDDSVRMYITELPEFAAPITLRHLIHNSSGLFDYGQQFLLTGWMLRNPLSDDSFFRLLERQRLTAFPAGTDFMYSNTDYALLAFAVKRATGKSLRMQADRVLFRPLGMTSTLIDDQFGEVAKLRAYDYVQRDGTMTMIRRAKSSPAGRNGVLTNVHDLARWANAIGNPKSKLSRVALNLRKGAVFDRGRDGEYNFGHFLRPYRGLDLTSHQGVSNIPYLLRVPARDVSIVYLDNGGLNADEATRAVLDEVFFRGPDPGAKSNSASVSQLTEWKSILAKSPKGVEVATQDILPLAGGYSSLVSSRGRDFTCEVRDGALVEVFGDDIERMIPLGMGVFYFLDSFFVFENLGRSPAFKVFRPSGKLVEHMQQVPSVPWPSAEKLAELVGNYYNYELDVNWSLVLVNGKLAVKRERMKTETLWASSEDRFALTVLADPEAYTYDVELRINRDSVGKVSGFSIWSGRLKGGLRFDRFVVNQ